jgi:UDP-N-acetylmuramate dehydrogenase
VFKNPAGNAAGRLIEAAGLKGLSAGDAQISRKHGNFIVNRGQASARDVLALVRTAWRRVAETSGTHLELEILLAGEWTPEDLAEMPCGARP